MATYIVQTPASDSTFTITLASLANGSARQSTMIDNKTSQGYPYAIVYLKVQLGGDPSSDGWINVYLLRGNDPSSSDYRTGGAGSSNAAYPPSGTTIGSEWLLGSIPVPSARTTNDYVYGEWSTETIPGPLGPEWGIVVENRSGVALGSTEGNHYKGYVYMLPEIITV